MEAAVAEKEAGMTEWSGDRLDELRERVDRIERNVDDGFKEMGQEFTRLDQKIDEQGQTMQKEFAQVGRKLTRIDGQFERAGERFDEMVLHFGRVESELVRVNDRLDSFHRSMTWAAWTLVIGMLGVLGVLAGKL